MHLSVKQKIVIIVYSFMSGFLAPFSTLVMPWLEKRGLKNLCTVSKHKLMMTYVRANLAQILTLAECAQRGQSLSRLGYEASN